MQPTDWIIAISTFVTTLIFIGILILTRKYANSTKEISNKTAESVKASKEFLDVTINLKKEELAFELIKQWYIVKKQLALEEEQVSREADLCDKGMCIKIVNYCVLPLEYFNLAMGMIESNSIDKDLFFKNMIREINYFVDERLPKLKEKYDERSIMLRASHNMKKGEFVNFNTEGLEYILERANRK